MASKPRPKAGHWWQSCGVSHLRDFSQRRIFWPVLRQLCRTHTVIGSENLDELDEPAIFIANHASHFDSIMVLSALPQRIRNRITIAAAQDYFYKNSFRGSVVSFFLNTFPFDRQHARVSLRETKAQIQRGWSVLLYPEGTRSLDGTIGEFKRGIGALVKATNVPVVPIFLDGPARMMPKGTFFPRSTNVSIHIGTPVRYAEKDGMTLIANDLHKRVLDLQQNHLGSLQLD